MNLIQRAETCIGKAVQIRTKSGETHKGVVTRVESDGEIVLDVPFGNLIFIAGGEIESISIPRK